MTHYDVIVIGSGAGTLVHRLAPAGKQVLLLERGEDPTEPYASAPYPYHRVTLRRDGSIQLSYEPTNQVPKERMSSENDIPVAGVAQQAGTCRFGPNPALTAMANALRVGDDLLERLGATSHEVAGVG
jgi:choline dehydrogenase-like flavoprotein